MAYRAMAYEKCIRKQRQPISFIAPDDIVFSTDEGALRTYYGTRAMFERFVKENGLAKYNIHFHTLRHTYSTMLFESGENPKAIQGLMGHKDVMTTLRNYNSVDQSQFRTATDKLDGLYKKREIAEL
jgi:site-specific recombinase XerD